jgi:hypothetical protein
MFAPPQHLDKNIEDNSDEEITVITAVTDKQTVIVI